MFFFCDLYVFRQYFPFSQNTMEDLFRKLLLHYKRKENADEREEITEEHKEVDNDMILSTSSFFLRPHKDHQYFPSFQNNITVDFFCDLFMFVSIFLSPRIQSKISFENVAAFHREKTSTVL